ncbi:MAG: AMP-binding protein, partial [Chloroflexi bacterium]|nr:AMP-binding protein [Chloroflexota bacterium]
MSQEVFVFPVSFAQQRLWFLEQLTPGNPVYNIARAIRLKGILQPTALLQALQVIADRHEILRTTFEIVDGEPMQMVAAATMVTLPHIDLTQYAPEQREAEARRIAAEEARRPFDLVAGPLLHATLLQLGSDDHWLILTVHHMIFDGWSYGIFCQELAALYRHFSGEAGELPELPIQYADYAVWQRDWFQGEILERQLDYWQRELADAPTVLALPTDYPRPSRSSQAGAVQPLALSPALTMALRQYSQGAHATMFMTLLAAFAVVLARHSGQAEVVIGVPVAGRTQPETAGLIGFFVNMLPLRVRVAQARSFAELVAAVRTATLAAYAQQDLPFEMLVEALAPERSLHHAPIFQVACSLQPAAEPIILPGLTVDIESVSTATAKLDLTLNMTETATGIAGGLEYNTELFAPATIARLAGHMVQLLESVLATPDAPLATIPLLSSPEYQQLVYAWNATGADYPADQTLHTLFERHAARTPDVVAVVCGAGTRERVELTYAELNARANQLAHHLQALGVGSDVRVGLCFDRSIELIIGMLAVLKAGAAYVPLDPNYPAERIAVMLEDAAALVVLTQQGLADRFNGLEATILRLDSDWDCIAAAPDTNLPQHTLPDSPAYVIFTSGSTGRP